jgi:hypothetical protein
MAGATLVLIWRSSHVALADRSRRLSTTGHWAQPGCTLAGMWNLPSNVPIPTTPVDQPYRVQLEAVPDRFQEDTVWVHDQVVPGDRHIVR